MLAEDELYEFSERSEKTIRLHWPDSLTPKHPLFERRMIELQLALIEGHMHTMYQADKRRALDTVTYLKKKVKEL